MISGLALPPAGRLLLQVPVAADTCRMLVCPADGRVDTHRPVDAPGRVGVRLQPGQDCRPGPVTLPAAEPVVGGLPGRIRLGYVAPGVPYGPATGSRR